ncbi:MAG: UDP-N-acetylmuramate:L-alanyl-gamma-D-glutamyl-meso-diaminopimelate ligase [Deltaproteobacteria bacterium]|nr:UDP-N-acetylmuramate:L-alanyl-gamma-D-glutamyl-meso-diaminopimelate ligase [Deltaproteobacteria bacterium]
MSPKRIHLIATCGMGMASLAGLLKGKGYAVSGSDQNIYPPMSHQLESLGIPIRSPFSPENLNPTPDLVIVGNAVSRNNPEVEAMLARGLPYLSMPQALHDFFLKDRFPIVIAGTHGKTTTSALTGWLLTQTGRSPSFLVGGILKNSGRSYQNGTGPSFVLEGDEYDSAFFDKKPKFLHYAPKILVLNPVEFDHADIYRDLDHVLSAFRELIDSLGSDTLIIHHGQNPNVLSLVRSTSRRSVSFGLGSLTDVGTAGLELQRGTRFHLLLKGKTAIKLSSPLIGRHNVENLLAAVAVLLEMGVSLTEIQEVLPAFQGVKRRQEILGTYRGVTLIDDFAHHPTAISETLKAIRACYPEARLWALFEPRSNTTRRKIFEPLFPDAFQEADETIIAPLYHPEKIEQEERLSPETIVAELSRRGKKARQASSIDEIAGWVGEEARPGDIVCLMSNGAFGGLAEKLTRILQ